MPEKASNSTNYGFYASLGGYNLPPEGFSVDKIPRSEMPEAAARMTPRLQFYLDLIDKLDGQGSFYPDIDYQSTEEQSQ